MEYELYWILLILSCTYLACSAGTYAALEVLSYVHPDKKSDERWWNTGYIKLLLDPPINAALFLLAVRGAALVAVAGLAIYIASAFVFQGLALAPRLAGVVFFAVLMVYIPAAASSYIAVRKAQKFIDVSKIFLYPIIILTKPAVAASTLVLGKIAPGVMDALVYRLIPLEQKIAMFGTENGALEEEEQRLMSSIFDFGDTVVREVMVPRIDIVAVNVNTSKSETLRIINDAGHSRVPVYDETIDKIIGIVYTKDLLRKIVGGDDFTLSEITRDVFFVPESKKIDDLLSEFKKQKKHMAIAVDEYGGTAGLITLEDVLEELVGDIQDEFDYEEELIKRIDGDSVLCNAKVHLDELKEALQINISEGGADSLGGFLYQRIGRVPRVGDTVHQDQLTYEIRSVLRQRIDKVLIKGLSSFEKGKDAVSGT
jgi:putative hemolysin